MCARTSLRPRILGEGESRSGTGPIPIRAMSMHRCLHARMHWGCFGEHERQQTNDHDGLIVRYLQLLHTHSEAQNTLTCMYRHTHKHTHKCPHTSAHEHTHGHAQDRSMLKRVRQGMGVPIITVIRMINIYIYILYIYIYIYIYIHIQYM